MSANDRCFQLRLRELRQSYGFTLEYMADLLGVIKRSYQRYEATGPNGREPKFDILLLIADYFCVSLDWLMGRVDDPQRDFFYSHALAAFKAHPATTQYHIDVFAHDIAGHENDYRYCIVALRAVEYNRDHPAVD